MRSLTNDLAGIGNFVSSFWNCDFSVEQFFKFLSSLQPKHEYGNIVWLVYIIKVSLKKLFVSTKPVAFTKEHFWLGLFFKG